VLFLKSSDQSAGWRCDQFQWIQCFVVIFKQMRAHCSIRCGDWETHYGEFTKPNAQKNMSLLEIQPL